MHPVKTLSESSSHLKSALIPTSESSDNGKVTRLMESFLKNNNKSFKDNSLEEKLRAKTDKTEAISQETSRFQTIIDLVLSFLKRIFSVISGGFLSYARLRDQDLEQPSIVTVPTNSRTSLFSFGESQVNDNAVTENAADVKKEAMKEADHSPENTPVSASEDNTGNNSVKDSDLEVLRRQLANTQTAEERKVMLSAYES